MEICLVYSPLRKGIPRFSRRKFLRSEPKNPQSLRDSSFQKGAQNIYHIISKMKKSYKITIWITIFILLLITSFLVFKYEVWETDNPKICCNNKCFNLEVADTPESLQLWLMYRKSLPDTAWMLFVFNKTWTYSFWMKNTLIPLAWIRLDSDLRIVDIIKMDPCKTDECPSYKPKSEAQYVLEINQWLISEKWLLKIWDKCELTIK